MTDKYVLWEIDLLGIKLGKQTDSAKIQWLSNIHGFNKIMTNKKCENSGLAYNSFNFNKFNISDEEFNKLPVEKKYKHQ